MSHEPEIVLDKETSRRLAELSAARGLSIDALVNALINQAETQALEEEELKDLEQRWDRHQAGAGVPHDDVVRWLVTWGQPGYKPWAKP